MAFLYTHLKRRFVDSTDHLSEMVPASCKAMFPNIFWLKNTHCFGKRLWFIFLSFFTIPTTTKHDPLLSVHNQHPLLLPASVSESATTPTISTTISPVSDSTRILYFSIFVSEFRIKRLGFKNQNPSGAGLPGPSIGLQVDPPSTLMLIPLMGFLALVTW